MPQTHKKEKFCSLQADNWQLTTKPENPVRIEKTGYTRQRIFSHVSEIFCLNFLNFAGGKES